MVDFCIGDIAGSCQAFGLSLDKTAIDRLNLYGNLLLSWNEKINLTAITEPQAVLYKHFYDCLLFFKNRQVPPGASVADVGTGAGFPGLVLKIARPDLSVVLLDSLRKRLLFLEEVIRATGLSGVQTLHLRAEQAGHTPSLREGFDFVTARAVAALPVLAEYCLPLAAVNGEFVAMKGPSAEQEAQDALAAIRLLGGAPPQLHRETLTGQEQRVFVSVKKISQTPTKYPRKPNEIAKQPL